jgi:phage-related protein
MTIAADKQVLLPGRRVELFDLDLDIFQTGLMYRFCSSFKETGNIEW